MSLAEIAFPYRANQQFGAASFSFVFLVLVLEIEVMTIAGFLLLGRLDLYLPLQNVFFPATILVSLVTAAVFAFRARSWTRKRLSMVSEYGAGAFGDRLAKRSRA